MSKTIIDGIDISSHDFYNYDSNEKNSDDFDEENYYEKIMMKRIKYIYIYIYIFLEKIRKI